MSENGGKVFKDKELQIAAKLAYMTFTSTMCGQSLNDLFKTNNSYEESKTMNYKDALQTLYTLRDEGKIDNNFLECYMYASRNLIRKQLEDNGYTIEASYKHSETMLEDGIFKLPSEKSY